MKVCVLGLWHLGSVTSACLASLGHEVVGYDADEAVIANLQRGEPPVGEPGLAELIRQQAADQRLSFTTDLRAALQSAQVLWVTYDTPVDDNDHADVEFVLRSVEQAFPHLNDGALLLTSSQVPVGSTAELERRWSHVAAGRSVTFGYSPENLRLGRALSVFLTPDRIVIGIRSKDARTPDPRVIELLGPLAPKVLWMSVESAEMTKHAVNAFLAASVTFINEIARLCEVAGADAAEVEQGLKSEARIGRDAYLGPGSSFAGGTLARDVQFLRAIGNSSRRPTPMFDGLIESNEQHRSWPERRLADRLKTLENARIAVWGLTYKPGTTTLRRSDSVALCRFLLKAGAQVAAHDPVIADAPPELNQTGFTLVADPIAAATGADALVVATRWPEYRSVDAAALYSALKRPLVLDANRFLGATVGGDARFDYLSVGRGR